MPDSDTAAYMYGLDDAARYDACDPSAWGFEDDKAASYNEGYGDQMDLNNEYDGGICPDDLRG